MTLAGRNSRVFPVAFHGFVSIQHLEFSTFHPILCKEGDRWG